MKDRDADLLGAAIFFTFMGMAVAALLALAVARNGLALVIQWAGYSIGTVGVFAVMTYTLWRYLIEREESK